MPRVQSGGNSKQRLYRCRQCANWYPHGQSLWQHIAKVHGSGRVFHECSQGDYQVGLGESVKVHNAPQADRQKGTEGPGGGRARNIEHHGKSSVPEVFVVGKPSGSNVLPSESKPPAVAPSQAKSTEGVPSPTSVSPPKGVPSLPTAVIAPFHSSKGKPRGIRPAATSSIHAQSSTSSTASSQPRRKQTRTATVREYKSTRVYLDGMVIMSEESNKIYLKQIKVDPMGRPLLN